jgi:hypothetical protein
MSRCRLQCVMVQLINNVKFTLQLPRFDAQCPILYETASFKSYQQI